MILKSYGNLKSQKENSYGTFEEGGIFFFFGGVLDYQDLIKNTCLK